MGVYEGESLMLLDIRPFYPFTCTYINFLFACVFLYDDFGGLIHCQGFIKGNFSPSDFHPSPSLHISTFIWENFHLIHLMDESVLAKGNC